jgi:hypothetical protein
MRAIFDAGPQRWKIWFVGLISLACGGALVWTGGYIFQSYGLNPLEGGVLKPLTSRILLGGAFAAAGIAIIAGILLYLRCYVTRIEADDAGGGFRVTVAGLRQPLTVSLDHIIRVGYSDGISNAGGISVNAPWYSLRLRGRRFPLIVDLQGDFLDENAVGRLLDGESMPAIVERSPTRKYQKFLDRQRRR